MNKIITLEDAKKDFIAISDLIGKKIKTFDFTDVMIYKATVFAFGTLVGTLFSKALRKIAWLIAIAAGLGAGYLIYKHFCDKD